MSRLPPRLAVLSAWLAQQRDRTFLPSLFANDGPLDLRILGRAVLQAAAVGVACGLLGALFLSLLDRTQHLLLEVLTGYQPLRAHGETAAAVAVAGRSFRPWLLLLLPAAGGLLCGLVTLRVPEARGGGGDPMIRAFHQGAALPARLIPVKMLASVLTLGTGGAGGREGPTMLIGGAMGSLIGRYFAMGQRERRVLVLAGVAAGIAAVFRTPLGAALLAVEIVYRDGFESDALIPGVLASVMSYSVVISIHGKTTLFGHAAGGFPFVPAHLPLYGALAALVALLALLFLRALRLVRRASERAAIPVWARPALGGLALGILVSPILVIAGDRIGNAGQGFGVLGGGYGAVQLAITGAPWLPAGWHVVLLLGALALAKLCAASFTIGSGGSAGDFAPSLAMGGLLGGAFGHAASLVLGDPRIDPGAFALVGMGAFYGGVAHVPLAALVLVCEMAGNYDLLVPLMLALGISSVVLRRHSLYDAQLPAQREAPAHRAAETSAAPPAPDPLPLKKGSHSGPNAPSLTGPPL
jgi:chloride channel protein, CIC family